MNTNLLTGPVDDGDDRGQTHSQQSAGRSSQSHSSQSEAPQSDFDGPPGGSRRSSRQSENRHRKRAQQPDHVPDRQALLAMLKKLLILTLSGAIQPASGNTALAMLRTLLHELNDTTRPGMGRGVDMRRLHDVLRQNPDMLDAIAPILSLEELRELTEDDSDDATDPDADS
jgi:hypothetical protein